MTPPRGASAFGRHGDLAAALPRRLAGGGRPLAPQVRAEMEHRFGCNFGHVRIHADREAGLSALALGARAFSLGRDIVFAPSGFAPETPAGRELLAHELVHVRQDGWDLASTSGPVRLDRPESAEERQAERLARATASRATSPAWSEAPARGPGRGRVIRRSLLGATFGGLLGGTVGAVGLGLLGGLLGPVGAVAGAVIGGLAGAAAGALLGDIASRDSRRLHSSEKAYLRTIYVDSVDYDAVTITRGSALAVGAARTTGNTINLQDRHFDGATMNLSDEGQLVLAHEMGHVWQYQNGGLAYIPSSLIPQIVAGITGRSRNVAYDWRSAVRNGSDWADWNAEQQAECISDYNEALRRINDGSGTLADYNTVALAEPYIALVRQRVGAPGSSRRRLTAPTAPAGSGAAP